MVQPSGTSVSVQWLPLSDLSLTQVIYCFVSVLFLRFYDSEILLY